MGPDRGSVNPHQRLGQQGRGGGEGTGPEPGCLSQLHAGTRLFFYWKVNFRGARILSCSLLDGCPVKVRPSENVC